MKHAAVEKLQAHLFQHYPQEAAKQIELMDVREAVRIIQRQDISATQSIWPMLAKDVLQGIFKHSDQKQKAHILNALPAQDLPLLWEPLSNTDKQTLLTLINEKCHEKLLQLETYPEGTIGRMMNTYAVTLREDMSVKDAFSRIRKSDDKNARIYYVLNDENKPTFYVALADMALADAKMPITQLAKPIHIALHGVDTQEDVWNKLSASSLRDLPVVDEHDRFIGIIKTNQIIQAAKEEAVSDIQTMVGVDRSETALSSVGFSIKKRLPWLQVNLVTAFLAAAVVGLFEGTIAKYTALAVLLPIVAGQSGNTGAQTLAVTMRSLTLKEITLKHTFPLIFKESRVAFVNGIVIALTTALAVMLWSKDGGLGFIIGISMVISMMIAAIAGACVPLVLTRLGQDPAQASSIILTTITDVAGFFSFLGIATVLSFLI